MKKHLLAAAVFCFLIAVCHSSAISQREDPVDGICSQVAQSASDFSFNFFKALQQTCCDTENIFVSPLSLHIDLSMLLNGACSETFTQL